MASASISATSVPADRRSTGAGLARQIVAQRADENEFAPRARLRIASRSICRLMPPLATLLFFSAMPPKASTMSVCSAI